MQKIHVQVKYGICLESDLASSRSIELADDRAFYAPVFHELSEFLELLIRYSESHPLLGFRDPSLPGLESWIFQWNLV